jgi:polyferredoxin
LFKNEQKHPFYRPLWRRVLIVVTVALWLAFEVYQQASGLWIALSGGMLVYAVYTFLITWPKDTAEDDGAPRG